MSWNGRNEKCWRANTPDQVGPGAYSVAQNRPQRTSTAPFDSAEPRLSTSTSQSSPGYYIGHKSWGCKNRCQTSFGSRAVRLADIKDNSPGPGSYNLSSRSQARSKQEKRVPMNVEVYRTPPSIPSREIQSYSLGPGSYDPSFQDNKPSSQGTVFGAYISKREVFAQNAENNIGPGQYLTDLNSHNKVSWMFTSSTKKAATEKLEKKEGPGPGSYNLASNSEVKEAPVGFGSNTRRNVPMTNDPHGPYVIGNPQIPPVGNYLSKEEQEKFDKLKKKLITSDYPIEKAPFGISEKRASTAPSNTPGPGHYQPVLDSNNQGLLPNKTPRFTSNTNSNTPNPGPGTYKPEIPSSQQTQKFTNKAPRFEKPPKKPSQASYSKHDIWRIKQTRSPDFICLDKTLSFDSTGQRFIPKTSNVPGPGQYDLRSQSAPKQNYKFGGTRSNYYGDYRPSTGTPLTIGPGTYEVAQVSKRTFNMAKELGKDNVWL